MLGQELRDGRSARKAAGAVAERELHGSPGRVRRLWNQSRSFAGPLAGSRSVRRPAHARIVGIIKDGRTRGPDCRPRRRSVPSPRCVRSNFASVVSPGKVRHPFSSAEFSMHQESPGDSGIGPEAARGHRPFRLWYASAQNKICFSVIGARTPHGPLPGNEFRE